MKALGPPPPKPGGAKGAKGGGGDGGGGDAGGDGAAGGADEAQFQIGVDPTPKSEDDGGPSEAVAAAVVGGGELDAMVAATVLTAVNAKLARRRPSASPSTNTLPTSAPSAGAAAKALKEVLMAFLDSTATGSLLGTGNG